MKTSLSGNHKQKGKYLFFYVAILFLSATTFGQTNLAEKLGYSSDAKLLIIHADDIGVSHSENIGTIESFEGGVVNSGSIMMPTPWVLEIAEYAKNNKKTHDLGLHLVLTAEWKNYRWRPVAPLNEVPSLINEFGYFHEECLPALNANEVEVELRAQIDLSYKMGIEPTHLDSHMGCLFWSNPKVLEVYLKMGQLYNLPVLVDNSVPEALLKKYDVKVVMDEILTIGEEQYANGVEVYYGNAIKSLKPGLSTFLIHTAYDDFEMQGMTVDHPHWGATWRQKDFDYFNSNACKKLLQEEGVILVTWREINKALAK